MAVTTFPDAPSFSDAVVPAPPPRKEGEGADEYLEKLFGFLQGQYLTLIDMQSSISSGWLIDTVRILNLEANTILANEIITNDFFIGADGNGSIEMSGSTVQLIVKDDAGTTRLIIGNIGAGATNWGIRVIDASGNVKFESSTTTFIDGAVINDATITNAKIVNATIDGSTKLVNSSVPNSKLGSDISASKITAGTLTINGSPGLTVTGTGNAILSNGADLIFNAASSGTTSYVKFRNNAGTSQGDLSWDVTSDLLRLRSLSGDCQILATSGDLQLYADVNIDILAIGRVDVESGGGAAIRLDTSGNIALDVAGTVCTVNDLFRPNVHKTHDLGSASLAWDEAYADNWNNVADILFQNGMVILEADKVYEGCPGEVGEFWLGPDKKPKYMLGGDGNLYIAGQVFTGVDFDEMFKQYKPIDYYERKEKHRIEKEARQQANREERIREREKKERLAETHRLSAEALRRGEAEAVAARASKHS